MSAIADIAQSAHKAFDRTTTTVQEIHETIVTVPFTALERVGLFEEAAAEGRRITGEVLGTVYDLLRDVSGRIAEFAEDALDREA